MKEAHHHQQQQRQQQRQRDVLLVLHGNHQTGELLLGRIERLTKRLKKEFGIEAIAPDAPFFVNSGGDDNKSCLLRTWWNRDGDNYVGLEDTLNTIQNVVHEETETTTTRKQQQRIVGILGFSQGARLSHLLAILHQKHSETWFPHLRFAILVAGYDKPIPPELISYCNSTDDGCGEEEKPHLDLPSLHIWGSNDALITKDEFEGLVASYKENETYVHPGKHHVPTKGSELPIYVDFIRKALRSSKSTPTPMLTSGAVDKTPPEQPLPDANTTPDEETAELQREEIQALEAIFPGALDLRSNRTCKEDDDDEEIFEFPIVYRITLNDMEMEQEEDEDETDTKNNWPKHPLTVEIRYPVHYPSDDLENHGEATTVPHIKLLHQNTVFEFPSAISDRLVTILRDTAANERGMPCVLSCLYAARDYLNEDRDWKESSFLTAATNANAKDIVDEDGDDGAGGGDAQNDYETGKEHHPLIRPSSPSDIRKGTLEGLEIAQALLANSQQQRASSNSNSKNNGNQTAEATPESAEALYRGSGSFGTYTIGLVGKPSAGKSTFFNAATAFSRQRGQHQEVASGKSGSAVATAASASSVGEASIGNDGLGGASMAAHPFTTIDPNIGYCLVPAPPGSCPEDDYDFCENNDGRKSSIGSSHGRDASGRRFLPVLLKDVAGLVPGAYQGKGRGNQFLNDLTDSAVLIHVVDASGSADASGNKIIVDDQDHSGGAASQHENKSDVALQELTNPLDDLAWIRAELVEWVYSNLVAKWETISRKGRSKLADMFSGYGQKVDMSETVFPALETFLEERYQRERSLDKIYEWDEADVQRLVSLFLGVRFPMALCLNKHDLPSSKAFVEEVQESLPIHGAHVGTPLSAKKEMTFVREQMMMTTMAAKAASNNNGSSNGNSSVFAQPPLGVWDCLVSAIHLREPVLVFPVSDMVTLAPMAGLHKAAVGDPSLPSGGMVRCIEASGGSPPSCWDSSNGNGHYAMPTNATTKENGSSGGGSNNSNNNTVKLRDVILMKPGSTVEDVFFTLKRLGALGGEFVRAEAFSGAVGERPKPVSKQEMMGRKNRVIKIMTNKRTQWQNNKVPEKNERRRYPSKR
jgi:ribosome-binding ATPase YchF (GTP1/OBG family)/predicted esterase